MDFVISDVATVEQDDDEPLFEITKVTVFKEKKVYNTKEVRPSKYIKICFVPLCPNTSKSTPEKMFITIPVNPARRKLWLDAVGKNSVGRNPKSPMFCCQDHFNLPKDMKNYEEHLRRGKVQMLLYQTVVPTRFICNKYGHLKRIERIEVLRKIHEKNAKTLDQQEYKEQEQQQEESAITVTNRQRSMGAAKQRKVETKTSNKTVFIEMPAFEYEDQPEYIAVKENGVDTIVIDDSD